MASVMGDFNSILDMTCYAAIASKYKHVVFTTQGKLQQNNIPKHRQYTNYILYQQQKAELCLNYKHSFVLESVQYCAWVLTMDNGILHEICVILQFLYRKAKMFELQMEGKLLKINIFSKSF